MQGPNDCFHTKSEMSLNIDRMKKEALTRNFKHNGLMSLGSWKINLHSDKKYYTDTLAYLFKQKVMPVSDQEGVDAILYLIRCKRDSKVFTPALRVPDNTVAKWEHLDGGGAALSTGRFRVVIFRDDTPAKIFIFIREPQYSHTAFEGHLFEIIHKILFMFERLYIHAAAAKWDDKICAFVGDRGGGKSTVCLKLAREGAQIISDDHIMVTRTGSRFLVSGCEETSRVTEKTEKGILGRVLVEKAAEYNGVMKKEILLKDFFECAHFQDFPIHDLFFINVGDAFGIQPISKQQAVVNLIGKTKAFFRFNSSEDLVEYLSYFSQLVSATELFKMTLSPELEDLNKLVSFLKMRSS